MQAACALCRMRRHRPRLMQACFADVVGKQIWKEVFHGFDANPRLGRFASTAFVPHVHKVERALRRRWNKSAFLAGHPGTRCRKRKARALGEDAGEDEHDTAAFVERVNGSTTEPKFWGWIGILEVLAGSSVPPCSTCPPALAMAS